MEMIGWYKGDTFTDWAEWGALLSPEEMKEDDMKEEAFGLKNEWSREGKWPGGTLPVGVNSGNNKSWDQKTKQKLKML